MHWLAFSTLRNYPSTQRSRSFTGHRTGLGASEMFFGFKKRFWVNLPPGAHIHQRDCGTETALPRTPLGLNQKDFLSPCQFLLSVSDHSEKMCYCMWCAVKKKTHRGRYQGILNTKKLSGTNFHLRGALTMTICKHVHTGLWWFNSCVVSVNRCSSLSRHSKLLFSLLISHQWKYSRCKHDGSGEFGKSHPGSGDQVGHGIILDWNRLISMPEVVCLVRMEIWVTMLKGCVAFLIMFMKVFQNIASTMKMDLVWSSVETFLGKQATFKYAMAISCSSVGVQVCSCRYWHWSNVILSFLNCKSRMEKKSRFFRGQSLGSQVSWELLL